MRNRKPCFFPEYITPRPSGWLDNSMVERNWRIVIVRLISVSGKYGALGALSVDMTQANSTLPDDSQHDGQSVRFLYNKSLNESGHEYSVSGLPLFDQRIFLISLIQHTVE
ncbi:hypothetical protein DMI70_04340 [Escherichia coli]|nr:hypothetical protein [Escherichia coli]